MEDIIDKKERYARLIDEAKNSYPKKSTGQEGELIWCESCQDEINLWTYWQGKGCLNPEILVVGQDWGNPETTIGKQCLRNIENQSPYLKNNTFPSDNNLAVLFEKALNIDIGKKNDRLFFTNLVLGYRTGKNTGALSSAQYTHDNIIDVDGIRFFGMSHCGNYGCKNQGNFILSRAWFSFDRPEKV